MPSVVNAHVTRLGRYLPFRPGHDQIYEERADPEQLRTIETQASVTLLKLVSDPSTRLVVLTGDAGHGKTHLCRVALEHFLRVDAAEAQRLLRSNGDGRHPVGKVGSRDLFVVRDLSEMNADGVERLEEALSDEGRTSIVCANEGKLRAVVAAAGGTLDVLRETLEHAQDTGLTSREPGVIVVDLNHQSVTSGLTEAQGFVGGLLKQWAMDGRRWRVCEKCPAKEVCPILDNRNRLAGVDHEELGNTRRDGFLLMLRVAEQAGASITIREALILVAFALTGGTDCGEVQYAVDSGAGIPEFRARAYFQALFDPPLKKDQRATLPLLEILARLDPGRNAIRSVDEAILSVSRDALDLDQHASGSANPSTRNQLRSEAERHRSAMAALRRCDYFDLRTDAEWRRLRPDATPSVPRAERLGFRHHRAFEEILSRGSEGATADVRDKILRGLEAVQDVRRGGREYTRFSVVDPAYGNVSGLASILAKEVSVKRIDVLPQSAHWKSISGDVPLLADAVDWVDRRVTVRFRPPSCEDVSLDLDLLQFEFVLRSSEGLASRKFFEGDIRRIVARLNLLAERGSDAEDEIKVVYEDKNYSIVVEGESRIVCKAE